ncbi:DNA-protecting protein DprA [Miniimonas arenae]|uniref:DNA-protecting protein DprA n=1 Tax=Miniimonas arenae TaxID=676201 RepID=A0A5C5BGY7_9MICO|nr:DNA-processing protein DprA [Miniimonas arenae]TNU77313.1 DNA-protecting protein DprA [Miniimonas arenae]
MAEPTADVEDPRLAAVAWARLAEPGDELAVGLVAALGPVAALAWLRREAWDPPAGEREPWERARARWRPRLDGLDPARELAQITRLGGTVLHPADRRWPRAFDDLGPRAPQCLWVRGDPELAAHAIEGGVAIVGARAATPYGEHVAFELAAALAGDGRVVVSGGAYGIDAVAHRASLAVNGPTVAVMAGGLDRFYPTGHTELLTRVAREGAVVSELGPGSAPSRSRFLTRNRLIAALAAACVVVEAGWRSGTMSTAQHAARLLRPVGAVPGPVTSASSAGCHRLLREQLAVCVTDAEEVRELVAELGPAATAGMERDRERDDSAVRLDDVPPGLAPREALVWEALPARGAAHPDSVVRVCGLAHGEVLAALGLLELRGHAVRDGDRVRRVAR